MSEIVAVNTFQELFLGDCLEIMPELPDQSVNMICTDLPYGTTRNRFDVIIPFEPMWQQFNRIIKDNGAIVLFGMGGFSAKLILSNEKYYRYSMIWQKTTPTDFLNANRKPLNCHEDIHVFYKKLPTYNPQKTTGHPRKVSTAKDKRGQKKSSNYADFEFTSYDSTGS